MSEIKIRTVMICTGKSCTNKGYPELYKKLEEFLIKGEINSLITIDKITCHGLHPIMIINPDNVLYTKISSDDIEEIVEKHLKNNEIVERLLLKNPITGDLVTEFKEAQYVVRQIKGKDSQ